MSKFDSDEIMVQLSANQADAIMKGMSLLLALAVWQHTGDTEKYEEVYKSVDHDFLAQGVLVLGYMAKDVCTQLEEDNGVLPILMKLALDLKEEREKSGH